MQEYSRALSMERDFREMIRNVVFRNMDNHSLRKIITNMNYIMATELKRLDEEFYQK